MQERIAGSGQARFERPHIKAPEQFELCWWDTLAHVGGHLVRQQRRRHLGGDALALAHANDWLVNDMPDDLAVQSPAIEEPAYVLLMAGVGNHEHTLLRLREHDVVG